MSDDTSLAIADKSAAPPTGGEGYSFEPTSELGSLIRTKDWSTTPIGPPERWSPTLKTVVDFLIVNRFPLLLWWGPQYVSIYNDAYRPILGTKHPSALGQPFREVWTEIEHVVRPLIDAPFNGGPATWMDDILLEVKRHGFTEETHFTIAYSPVPDETAPRGIGGVLATVHEITDKIVGERRITVLRDLGVRAGEARTAESACTIAARALEPHTKDIPFALLYLLDAGGVEARLAASSGVDANSRRRDAIGRSGWNAGRLAVLTRRGDESCSRHRGPYCGHAVRAARALVGSSREGRRAADQVEPPQPACGVPGCGRQPEVAAR